MFKPAKYRPNAPADTDEDIDQLRPDERAALARLALRLAYGDEPIRPDFIFELVRRLDRTIATANRTARAKHWQANASAALAAAHRYIQAANSGQPVSLTAVAKQFGTSERSVSRYVRQLKTAAGANGKVEAAQ